MNDYRTVLVISNEKSLDNSPCKSLLDFAISTIGSLSHVRENLAKLNLGDRWVQWTKYDSSFFCRGVGWSNFAKWGDIVFDRMADSNQLARLQWLKNIEEKLPIPGDRLPIALEQYTQLLKYDTPAYKPRSEMYREQGWEYAAILQEMMIFDSPLLHFPNVASWTSHKTRLNFSAVIHRSRQGVVVNECRKKPSFQTPHLITYDREWLAYIDEACAGTTDTSIASVARVSIEAWPYRNGHVEIEDTLRS